MYFATPNLKAWLRACAESLSSLWKYFFLVGIHCSVYIINSLLAANCMFSWAQHLFDCKPRFIQFFFHFMRLTIKGDLHLLLFCFIEKHKWHSAFPWLRFVHQILLTHPIFFSITCTSVAAGIMINRRQS